MVDEDAVDAGEHIEPLFEEYLMMASLWVKIGVRLTNRCVVRILNVFLYDLCQITL
jgi:hypothetical protein